MPSKLAGRGAAWVVLVGLVLPSVPLRDGRWGDGGDGGDDGGDDASGGEGGGQRDRASQAAYGQLPRAASPAPQTPARPLPGRWVASARHGQTSHNSRQMIRLRRRVPQKSHLNLRADQWPLADPGARVQAAPSTRPCRVDMKDLGPIPYPDETPDIQWLQTGGRYSPSSCAALYKVAIVVPFRDRAHQLMSFLNVLHVMLRKQLVDYGVFLIEQIGKGPFNRGKLLNVGFVEAQKLRKDGWTCFIFHDIDLLPLDSRNLYTCPKEARQMCRIVDSFNLNTTREIAVGGVFAMRTTHFQQVNGFSNKYWDEGGEDQDMVLRILAKNKTIAHNKKRVSRYKMLDNDTEPLIANSSVIVRNARDSAGDGLSSLKYKPACVQHKRLYTHVFVNVGRWRHS